MKNLMIVVLFLSIWLSGCNYETYPGEIKFMEIEKKMMASVNDLTRVPPKVELANEPYIKGKIVVFEVLYRKGDKFKENTYFMTNYYFREMEETYAAAPEEVGTVGGFNGSGQPAFLVYL